MTERRTRDEQRARTRRDLLDAAARVFAAKGFHAASVDDVAEAAGYTKGAVYSNFDSKEELFLALFEQSAERAVSTVDELLEMEPGERIAAFGQRHDDVEFFTPQWQLLEAEFSLYVARNPHLQPRLAERQRQMREQIGERIGRHLQDVGATTSADLVDLARIIGAAGDGLTMQQIAEGHDPAEMRRLFTLMLGLVFQGAVAS